MNDIICMIYRGDLKDARKALRPMRKTNNAAAKAFNLINNVLSGAQEDIAAACTRAIVHLQGEV